MQEIDLDEYNITSDDFRLLDLSNGKLKSNNFIGKLPTYNEDQKANETKGHPLVPKLDFTNVVPDFYESSNEMTPQHEMECDIDDEKGVQSEHKKHFFNGSQQITTEKRLDSLEKRKQFIINILYQQ